jgi:hypothetical protein
MKKLVRVCPACENAICPICGGCISCGECLCVAERAVARLHLSFGIIDGNDKPSNTARSRLVQGWAKFARRVRSYFKGSVPA